MIAHGKTVGLALCKALGLDAAQVTAISVDCSVDDAAKVVVERMLTDSEGEAVVEALSIFHLSQPDD